MSNIIKKSISIKNIIEDKFPDIMRNAKEFNYSSQKKEAEIVTEDSEHRYVHKIKVYNNVVVQNNIKVNIPDKKKNLARDIIKMYEDGYTQAEIAKMLGISQSYISKILKSHH